jgi:iron-sulfur cluster assembly protein
MALLDIQTDIQTDEVILTPAASAAVKELMEKRDLVGYSLRVYVGGGGCSGYQYGMALDNNVLETDHVFKFEDVNLIVDPTSFQYLRGATVDYVDELMGSGFHVENPNAVASCGCGHSFRTSDDAPHAGGGSCC